MFTSTNPSTNRRKPGVDENPFPFPVPSENSFVRRRKLLRWLRSRSDISANLFKVIDSILDRILTSSMNLIGWDSVATIARRTGLSHRVINFAIAEMVRLGLGVRLSGRRLTQWLDSFGTANGFAFPDQCGSRCTFTVLLFHLTPEVASHAQACATQTASSRAEIDVPETKDLARRVAQESTFPLPIGNSGLSESGSSNRQKNGSHDLGGNEEGDQAESKEHADARAKFETMLKDPVLFRMARLGLATLGPPPIKSPPIAVEPVAVAVEPVAVAVEPVAVAVAVEPVAVAVEPVAVAVAVEPVAVEPVAVEPVAVDEMARGIARSHKVPTAPGELPSPAIQPGSRIWDHVRDLVGAPASSVESITKAIMNRFRDYNQVTELTYMKYLGLVREGKFSAELVAGLVQDACQPGVRKPARHLSKAMADEWNRVENRSPGSRGKFPGDRS